MPQLTVPEPHQPGLQKLVDYDDDAIETLLSVLQGEIPATDAGIVSYAVAAATQSGLDPNDVRQIVDTLIALYLVRTSLDESIPQFAEELGNARNIAVPDDKRQRFKDRLVRLLDVDALFIASRARDVLSENAHNFHGVRILTDVRPVFRDDMTGPPAAMTIMHTIKLRYHLARNLDVEDFFIALSPSDLRVVRDAIDRAEAKASSVQQLLDAARMPQVQADSHIPREREAEL